MRARGLFKHALGFFLAAFLLPSSVSAGEGNLEFLAPEGPQVVFAGSQQTIQVIVRNPTTQILDEEIFLRLYQTSSATRMPVGDGQSWKKLRVLPGQTVMDATILVFPAIKTGTGFQVQWSAVDGRTLGHLDVMVYPEDLLGKLKSLAGQEPVGLVDGGGQLAALLKKWKVDFTDLRGDDLREGFKGRLILAVFSSKEEMTESLRETLIGQAKRGAAVVWIQPTTVASAVHVYHLERGAIVAAPLSSIAGLKDSPSAQLNLLRSAELALQPDPHHFFEGTQP